MLAAIGIVAFFSVITMILLLMEEMD